MLKVVISRTYQSSLSCDIMHSTRRDVDTINHAILIGKLRKYGIQDIAGDWMESYLENRKQYCAANVLNLGAKTATFGISRKALVLAPSSLPST